MPDGSQGKRRTPHGWQRIFRDPQRTRLDEEVRIATLRLQHLRAGLVGDATVERRIADQIETALTAAQQALLDKDIDTGYGHLHLARELEFGLLGDVELQARTIELRAEAGAGKYGQRRGKTILSILDGITPDPKALARDDRAIVGQAARIAMTASSNEYRKLTILRRHQTILLLIATITLAAAAIITIVNADAFDEIDHWWVAAVAVLLGALGALASALQRSTGQSDDTIPQKLTSYVVSLSRPLLGATAGLVAYAGYRYLNHRFPTDDAGRLLRAGSLATADLEGSIAEVQRLARLGFKCLTLPCKPIWGGHDSGHVNYNLPHFDPLWAVIQDANLPITFHVSTGRDPRAARGNGGAVVNYVSHSLSPTIEPVANLCASGVLERFPRIRFATIEAGIGWVPWLLDAMDEAYKKHHFWVRPKLKNLPSDYYRAHGFSSFQEDKPGLDLAESHKLDGNFMWANDYPHHEGTWPHSAEAIERTMGQLSDKARANILGLNCARFLGIDVPAKYRQ